MVSIVDWLRLGLMTLLLGCSGRSSESATARDVARPDLGHKHPLRERIWDATAAGFIDEAKLVRRLATHRHVLLGERHDNPRHHRIQARLLRGLVEAGRRPAVAWEMINDDQRQALSTYLADREATARGLGQALGWSSSGWPPWPMYRPIAEVALTRGLSLAAAGISRRALRQMLRPGPGVEPKKPDKSLPPGALADLRQVIRDAHCGHAKGPMLGMMVLAQKLRDAHMARRLEQAAKGADGAVLIAGNGHVRRDRGVPFHLAGCVSVGIVEVQPSRRAAADYARGVAGLGPAFDYLWYTTRVDNVDPCERFREQLQRMRARKESRPR